MIHRGKTARGIALLLVVGTVLVTMGCGTFGFTHRILKANKALAQAEVEDAEKYAPYEYTYAVEFQKKAKEEMGYADYQAAMEYAKIAEEYALKAKEIARKAKMEEGR